MGQKHWAIACAFVFALVAAPTLTAQQANNPFADVGAIASETGEPGRPGPGDSREATAASPGNESAYCPKDAERRIDAILNQPLREPWDFVEQPLRDVAAIISETYDIPIQFDVAALDAVAASPDVEVTISINNVSLRSALELMLRNAGAEELTYIIGNEVLLITTAEESESRPEVKVYRVDDLIVDSGPAGNWFLVLDYDALIDVITANVEKESWAENGTGEGEVHAFPPGMIVISTTSRVHKQIACLLAELRRNKQAVEAANADERAEAERRPVLHAFALGDPALTASKEAQEIVRKSLMQSVDWTVDDGEISEDDIFLHVLPQRIVVRHVPSVVLQVEEAARRLSPGFNNVGAGFGGGLSPSKKSDSASEPKGGGIGTGLF